MKKPIEPIYRKIGREIRNSRLCAGMTQLELARNARTSRSHIANMERGEERIRIHTLQKVAQALKIDLHWFFY